MNERVCVCARKGWKKRRKKMEEKEEDADLFYELRLA